MGQKINKNITSTAGGNKMREYAKNIDDQKSVFLDKILFGFLMGAVSLLSIGLIGGSLYILFG